MKYTLVASVTLELACVAINLRVITLMVLGEEPKAMCSVK